MSTQFPTEIDTLNNPVADVTYEDDVGYAHPAQHADANDAIEALETKVGKDSSAVTTSHDYKLSNITGTEKACSLQDVYPVGSIYINATNSTNPATLLGFDTWVAFGAGKVMVGLNAAETEFDTAEETGGEKTHALTLAELAAHDHGGATGSDFGYRIGNGGTAGGGGAGNDMVTSTGATTNGGHTHSVASAGSGTAHNNLPPYITVYLWKRTV